MSHVLIFFTLTLLHLSSCSIDPAKITFTTSASSAPITLTQLGTGYIVSISIQNGSDTTSNFAQESAPTLSKTVSMMLSLYSSTTLLTSNCFGFYPSPTSWEDNQTTNLSSTNYPYFAITNATEVPIQFYLSSDFYNTQLDSLMADSCSGMASSSYGSGSSGLLGMGIGGLALNNYDIPPLFSIYLNDPSQDGYLFFSTELSNTQSSTPVNTLETDDNWHVSDVTFLKIGSIYYQVSSINLIFDLNTAVIGFPLQIYLNIIKYLSGLSCPPETYSSPLCQYTGQVANLPNLVIGVGNQQILLPPKVYAQSGTANNIILNIKALSPNLGGDNYVTSAYSNYIILGTNVMCYYYSVFNSTKDGGTITLYAAVQNSDLTLTIVFIVLGFVVLLIFLAFLKGCKKEQIDKNSEVMMITGVYPTFSDTPVNFPQQRRGGILRLSGN